MNPGRALIIFSEVPNKIETHLAAALTADQAAELKAACISDTLRLTRKLPFCDVLVFSAGGTAYFADRRRGNMRVYPQRGNNLGERLERAFRKAFRLGYKEVVVIGTDAPWTPVDYVRKAFTWLAQNDLVLGPTEDGCYFLLGMSRFVADVFRGISWTADNVCMQTLHAARQAGLRTKLCPLGFDLERPEDLARAEKLLKKSPRRSPALAKVIRRMATAEGAQRYLIQPPPRTTSPS